MAAQQQRTAVWPSYTAEIVQDVAPPYLLALIAVEADETAVARLATEVARDVTGEADPSPAAVAEAGDALAWLLASLRAGPLPDDAALRALREDAGREARAGRPLRPVLDRTLSAGWLLWQDASARGILSADGLGALGEALLRTGDAAAAAIADAHAVAEREIATRSASALRELLDDLLELAVADDAGRARLVRRLAGAGIPVELPVTVIVVDAGRDLADGDPAVVETARRLGRGSVTGLGDPRALGGPVPASVVAAAHGRLVLLVPASRAAPDVPAALDALGSTWVATSASAVTLLDVAAATREASAALSIAVTGTPRRRIVPSRQLALERALLAEPALLRSAIDIELGPLLAAPRAAGLVETLETYLGERENVRAAARRLGVAPRTVTYRLERIERLLGGRLDADRRLRLATVLFVRRLLRA
jgi:hypothetical protein